MDSSPTAVIDAPARVAAEQPSRWSALRQSLSDAPLFPLAILFLLVFTAVFANWLSPHDPTLGNLRARYLPPVWAERGNPEHVLGTDHMGRDILSRIIHGSRISLVVATAAVLLAGTIGTTLGILSGYRGGWIDQVVMRLTDAWMALPTISFAILLAALLRPSEWNLVVILAAVYWTRYARVIRGEVLSLKERDFVRLAMVAGCSHRRIMCMHILPNIANSAIVMATLQFGVVIIAEATLSFLGVGVAPPQPAWGLMLFEGKSGLMTGFWWLSIFPGACIMLVVLAANLLGDWFRVWSDPQLRQL
jgi:peptide/nickel transport system permease protein